MSTNGPPILEWEDATVFPDCAFAALGDPSLQDDESWLQRGLPCLVLNADGFGMVYGQAECDGLPIECGRSSGRVIAARMEFTCDISELESKGEGRWVTVGRLRVGGHGAIAMDKKHQHLDSHRKAIALPAGWYAAQVFETTDDHVGIRIVAEVA